jgi:anti-sigma B factor antagonist
LMLDVDTTDVEKTTVCTATGELDALSASTFRAVFPRCLGRSRLVIDLTGVRFIDSAGLTTLVGLVRRTRELMVEVAVCARGGLRKVLLDSGLDSVVKVAESTETALAELQATVEPTGRPGRRGASASPLEAEKGRS